jgi:hypothetical protein
LRPRQHHTAHVDCGLDVLQLRLRRAFERLVDLVVNLIEHRAGMQMPPASVRGSTRTAMLTPSPTIGRRTRSRPLLENEQDRRAGQCVSTDVHPYDGIGEKNSWAIRRRRCVTAALVNLVHTSSRSVPQSAAAESASHAAAD